MLAHDRSSTISAVTRVIANTNTRSKNSSSGVTRCSYPSAGAPMAATLLIVMYGPGLGHVQHAPAGAVQPAAELHLIGADPADALGGVAPDGPSPPPPPVDASGPRPPA